MSKQCTVLVVDDEDICLRVTSKMIEQIGFPVISARNGVEAVQIFRRQSEDISCVLMDIHMPQMNGIDAFREIQEVRDDVRVIIASGYVNKKNVALLEPLKPQGYLKKPLTPNGLSTMLKKVLPADCEDEFKPPYNNS